MIVGLFLRHYKTYNGIYFVPITINEFFSVYFGPNGIGKSSILEAMDSFFNERSWNINKFASSHGFSNKNHPYIAPVYLIKRDLLPSSNKLDKDISEKIIGLSEYFWNVPKEEIKGNIEELNGFIEFRDDILKKNYSQHDYCLLIIGKRKININEDISFGPFHNQESLYYCIRKNADYNIDDEYLQKNYSNVLKYIMSLYSYIYIPSDIDVQSYTKLENQDIQKLMHKDIQDAIKNAITDSKLDQINQSLKDFVDEISMKIKDYEYRKPTDGTSKIVMSDLISKIVEAYFSIRVLSKRANDKFIPVSELSSGEKRMALVDLAFAFLNEKEKHEKNIILGIDEPEVSLHISACYDQFEKLRKMAKNNHQIIITTHWYGFLPVVNSGFAHNVYKEDDKIKFNTYSLEKYQEEIALTRKQNRGQLPYDIYLKSTNDLGQSIIASLRADNFYNYILCEGSSDSIYLRFYLSEYIEKYNLRIMPLGGCGEIIRILENLETIVKDKNAEIKGTMLGLIDTDTQYPEIDIKEPSNKKLLFRRMLFDASINDIKLVNQNDHNIVETQIEHVLDPVIFFKTIKSYNDQKIDAIFNDESVDLLAKCSRNVIDFTDNQRSIIKKFFSSDDNYRKVDFAHRYTKFALETKDRPIPAVFLDIKKIFSFEDEININSDKPDELVRDAENNDVLAKSIEAPKGRVIVIRKK
jgi:energy-coupling factor transporter ATP-binding protein EcfA2